MGYPKFEYDIEDKFNVSISESVGNETTLEDPSEPIELPSVGIHSNNGKFPLSSTLTYQNPAFYNFEITHKFYNLNYLMQFVSQFGYKSLTIALSKSFKEIVDYLELRTSLKNSLSHAFRCEFVFEDFVPIVVNGETVTLPKKNFSSGNIDFENGDFIYFTTNYIELLGKIITKTPNNTALLLRCSINNISTYFNFTEDTYNTYNNVAGVYAMGNAHNLLIQDKGTGNTQIIRDASTTIISNVGTIDTSQNRVKYTPAWISGYSEFYFVKANNTQLHWKARNSSFVETPSPTPLITIKDPSGNSFNYDNYNAFLDINNGYPTNYWFYFYNKSNSKTIFYKNIQSTQADSILYDYVCEHIKSRGFKGDGEQRIFFGGSKNVYSTTNLTNFELELSLDFTPTSAKFLALDTNSDGDSHQSVNEMGYTLGNLMYIASDSVNKKTEIWMRTEDGTWEKKKTILGKAFKVLYTYSQKREKYSSSQRFIENYGLVILINTETRELYYWSPKVAYFLAAETYIKKLIGCRLTHKSALDEIFEDHSFVTNEAPLSSANISNTKLRYCSIFANNVNAVKNIAIIENCIIKSNKKGIVIKKNKPVGADNYVYIFNNIYKRNLVLARETGIYIDNYNIKLDANFDIKNNTIVANNGVIANLWKSEMFKNNIIYAINKALYYNNDLIGSDEIDYCAISGKVLGFTIGEHSFSNCNPLFINVPSEDFRLQSIAREFVFDSICLNKGSDEKDLGCYDEIRINQGEANKKVFELTGYIATNIKISKQWNKKESAFDYRGNYFEYLGAETKVVELLLQETGLLLQTVRKLENLIQSNKTVRFYPYNDDIISGGMGIPCVVRTEGNQSNYVRYIAGGVNIVEKSITLTNANDEFVLGILEGCWIMNQDKDKKFYVKSCDSKKLHYEDPLNYGSPDSTMFAVFYLVRFDSNMDEKNLASWTFPNQSGFMPSVKMYVVEG